MTSTQERPYDNMVVRPPRSLEPVFKDPEHWGIPGAQWYKHQTVGVRWMKSKRHVMLNDDMGLGKTMQSLAVFSYDVLHRADKFPNAKLLIVCPATVKKNWGKEVEKFTRLEYVVLQGTPTQRAKKLAAFEAIEGPAVLVVNYELVDSYLSRINKIGFHMAIFDEGHMMKTPDTKRTTAARAIKTHRSFILTGTPLLKDVSDLWVLLDRCAPGKWGGYHQFLNKYAVFGSAYGRAPKVIGVQNEDELKAGMAHFTLRRMKEEVLDLPGIQIVKRVVGMHREQQKMYDQVWNDLRVTLADGTEEDIDSAAVRFVRTLQICGTTRAVDTEGPDVSEKLDLAVQDASQLVDNGKPVVVFTGWRGVHEAFVARMKKARPGVPVHFFHGGVPIDKRQDIVDEWNKTSNGVLVVTYQTAGVGLNLTHAAHGLRLDKTIIDGVNKQAQDRLNRIGADLTQKIQMFDYYVQGSTEHRVNQIVAMKAKMASDVQMTTREMMLAVMEAEKNGETLT